MARTRRVENSLFAYTQSWVEALADQYFYRADQLDVGVDTLAVYRDAAHRQPLLLVCGTDIGRSNKAIQHAREHGFQFLVTGSPEDFKAVKLGVFEDDEQAVAAFPTWMPGHPRRKPVRKTTTLLPFASEHDLRAAFGECHDLAYKALANDPAATFDLILLVMAAKVLDERSTDTDYRFGLLADDQPNDSSERLASLIAEAANWLDGSAASLGDVPRVPTALASRLLAVFQNYSLTLTAKAVGGTDILGTAYETIVGATFRGELGSYFTPRTMADFIGRLLDVRSGRVLDPACGSAGLLLAIRRISGSFHEVEYFGNDLNPRMVRAAKVNFLLHGLDPGNVLQGDGLQLDRIIRDTVGLDVDGEGTWWNALPDGPFDAVVANPPFAGFESEDANLRRIETAYKNDGSLRSLNRTLPFIESIVGSLRLGGVAGLVLPTSILNAEEESFVRLRQLLLTNVELMAIIGLPEKAFVHTDCGVHGALLFIRRVAKPRADYDVFVDWAVHLGYDRLGRYRRENDFPTILDKYRSDQWPERNSFPIQTLIEHGRIDPAWLHVVRSLPSAGNNDEFVPLTDLLTVRDARFSKREIDDDGTYHFFEVADTDLETGRVLKIHESSGFELRKKGRIRNRVQAGDVLLPNHRDSLIAKGAPTGRSAGLVNEEADGALTTDRFLVLTPQIDPALLRVVLNSAGVRRQIVAQCRGAASLDIREKTLASVLVPRTLVDGDGAEEIKSAAADIIDLRLDLEDKTRKLRSLVDATFGDGDADFRPTGWSNL